MHCPWASEKEDGIEGKIKAPPSVGVQVVGIARKIATALKTALRRFC